MRTEGFDVLVHEVIAAMTTLPCLSESFTEAGTCSWTFGSSTPIAPGLPPSCSHRGPFAAAGAVVLAAAFGLIHEGNALGNDSPACERTTRSCGRFGRASDGSTLARSSDSSSEYCASGVLSSWNNPCSRP